MLTRSVKPRTAELEQPVQAGALGYDLWSYNAFVRQVESALEGQHLGYTRRLRLLKMAANLGVRRFDAAGNDQQGLGGRHQK